MMCLYVNICFPCTPTRFNTKTSNSLRETATHRGRHRETEEREIHEARQYELDTQRETEGEREMQRETEEDRGRQRETEGDRKRERH